jgi:hypothetical protein
MMYKPEKVKKLCELPPPASLRVEAGVFSFYEIDMGNSRISYVSKDEL